MIVIIIAYILNIADYLFTRHWVQKFGIEIEGNPLGRWMFENNIAWAVKILAVGGALAALGYLIHIYPKTAWVAYIPLGVYAGITVYHIIITVNLMQIK